MQQDNRKCCNSGNPNNCNKKEEASSCSKLYENNPSKIPIYVNKSYSCSPTTSTQPETTIPKDKVASCCGKSQSPTKNTDSQKSVSCSKEVKRNVSEKISSKPTICYPKECGKKTKGTSSRTSIRCSQGLERKQSNSNKCDKKSKEATSKTSICCSKSLDRKQSNSNKCGKKSKETSSRTSICCSKNLDRKQSNSNKCGKKSKETSSRTSISCSQGSERKQSQNLQTAKKSITDIKCCRSKPEIDESVFHIGQFKVTCNKSTVQYETSETRETEHITTVSIDTNEACRQKQELTKKCPSCCTKRSKSSKSVCCTSKSNVGTNDENRIVLPEVQIEIGPQRLQTIQIDVKPTDLNAKSSGIITIPVQLRFKKLSSPPPPKRFTCCATPIKTIPSIPDYQKKHTLVYEACDKNEYFQEMYMDELAEEEFKKVTFVKIPEDAVERFAIVQEPDNPEFLTVEEDLNDIENNEIVEVQETPWYQSIENDNYVEPYLQEGYCTTGDNVEVQTDLVLGLKLLSESLNSIPDNISRSRGRSSSKFICKCGTASELIDWQIVFLPPANTINIKSDIINADITEENEEETPKAALFSEPPDSNPPVTESAETELVPIPEKYNNLVYKSNNEPYEPYLQNLLKQFPDTQFEPENEDVQVQLPWKKMELPNEIQIRKIQKFILTRKLPVCCISAPCMYGGCAKSTANCTCVAGPVSLGNLNSLFQYTTSERSLLSSLPCPYHKRPNSKFTGNNGIKCKALTEKAKNKEFCAKITYNVPRDANTNMFAKVTFKDNNNINNPSPYLSTGKNITPKSSKSVTYKYLNSNMVQNTEESNTDILCNLCDNSRCDYRKKIEEPVMCTPCKPDPRSSRVQLKPDPVVAAFQACEAELKPVREALIQVQRKLKNLHMPELDCMFKKKSNEFFDVPSYKCQCPPCGCQFNPNQWNKKPPCICKSKNVSTTNTSSKNSVKFKKPSKRNKAIQKTGSQYKGLCKRCLETKSSQTSNKINQNSKRNKAIQKSGSHYKRLKGNEGNKPSDDYNQNCASNKVNKEKYSSSSASSRLSQNTVYYSTSSSPSDNCSDAVTCTAVKKKLKVRRRLTSINSLGINANSQCPFLEAMQFMINKKNHE